MEDDLRNVALLENTEYEVFAVFHCANLVIINCNFYSATMNENYWVKMKQVAKKAEIVNKIYCQSF